MFSFLSSRHDFVHPVCVKRPTTARWCVCVCLCVQPMILVYVSYGIGLWFGTGYTAGRFYVRSAYAYGFLCNIKLFYYIVYLRQTADVPLSPAATPEA